MNYTPYITTILLAVCVAINAFTIMRQRKTINRLFAYGAKWTDLRERAAIVHAAQAERKRVNSPQDMKRANLALDRAIEELV